MRPLADILTELHTTKAQLDTVKERGGTLEEALTLAEKYRQLSLELEQSHITNQNSYYGWVYPHTWYVAAPTYHSGWYWTGTMPLTHGVGNTTPSTITLTTLSSEE